MASVPFFKLFSDKFHAILLSFVWRCHAGVPTWHKYFDLRSTKTSFWISLSFVHSRKHIFYCLKCLNGWNYKEIAFYSQTPRPPSMWWRADKNPVGLAILTLEYDDANGENTLLSKPVYSAVTLYLLNFIVFTSDKPIDLYHKNVVSYFVKCEV